MLAPRHAFPCRPLGGPPFIERRYTLVELEGRWRPTKKLALCPPPDLINPIVRKLIPTGAPVLLMIPDYPFQPLYKALIRISQRIKKLLLPPNKVCSSPHRTNAIWLLLMLHPTLGVLASSQLTSIAGGSTVADDTAQTVMDYAKSLRTNSMRQSQWNSWLKFCPDDQRAPLPAAKVHVSAFLGLLKSERILRFDAE